MILSVIAGVGLGLSAPQGQSRLLVYEDASGKPRPVRSASEWASRRGQILAGMQQAMGKLPSRSGLVALDVKTLDEVVGHAFTRRAVTFAAADGNRIPAYLYVPKNAAAQDRQRRRSPAVLALHPTSPLGKAVVDGQGKRKNRAYARELAERGYVVLAPDYPSFGDYEHDFANDDYVSGTMKGIVDHMRAVDLLQSLPTVDPERIGVIGHSLGGHNARFVAAFDRRLKVIVSSCGWTPFHDYYGGKIAGWTSARYMPLLRARFGLDPDRIHAVFADYLDSFSIPIEDPERTS